MKEGVTIYSVLSSDGDVSALIGTRIYRPGHVPQSPTAPYIVYFRVTSEPFHGLTDFGNTENILEQFNCYADDKEEAEDLAQKVRAALASGMNVGFFRDQEEYDEDIEMHLVILEASLWL